MLVRFIKNWTLPLAMLAGTLGYFFFADIPFVAPAKPYVNGLVAFLTPLLIFSQLLLTFCKVEVHELKPKSWHGWLLLFQTVSCLIVAVLLVCCPMEEVYREVFEGAMVCLICPTATAAAVITGKLGGSASSLTTYTLLSNLLAAAMDGNYSAENVYFADDLTYTAAIGVLTVPSSGSGTIAASGKNVKDVLASILAKEKNPTATQPAVTITCKQIAAYEVGSKVVPAYTASLNAGSYTYGPATGITATAWSVTAGTATKDTASGSFDELTVGDATSYAITATATHGEGAVPVTNLGNEYAAGKIAAGNKSKATGKITGYRNSFYGTLKAKDGEVNSALVRGLSGKSGKALAAGNSFNLAVPVGAIRVVFAYPATLRDVSSVQDVNGMNAEVKTAFTKTVVSVEGANGYQAIDYKVYVMDMANANDTANTYKVTI